MLLGYVWDVSRLCWDLLAKFVGHVRKGKRIEHGVGEVPGLMEMIPTSLPELPKPSGTPGNCLRHMCYNPNCYRKNGNIRHLPY